MVGCKYHGLGKHRVAIITDRAMHRVAKESKKRERERERHRGLVASCEDWDKIRTWMAK